MKNKLLSVGLVGLTGVLLSSFMLVQKGNESQEPKKSRHIKMVKIEDGKKMELDTVLTGNDVFVWNGDTINPEKHIKKFNRTEFDKMHRFDVKVDRKGENEDVMIINHKGGQKGDPAIWSMSPDDGMEVITEDIDSVGKQIIVRKRMKDAHGNNMIYFNEENMKDFPPMPPMPPVPPVPPVPHMKMIGIQHSGQIIDLNDPNIISFKKKEMSGDREKIEIIRKKSGNKEESTFNFQFDDELMPPNAPEFNWKSDGDSLRTRIIEKRKMIKGKDGKEIDVKVETEENK